jgi:hypothetical protein
VVRFHKLIYKQTKGLTNLKEISKQEKNLLIAKGYIKIYVYTTPIHDNNGRFLYNETKNVYTDLTITNKAKSSRQKYFTKDSFVELLHSGKLN